MANKYKNNGSGSIDNIIDGIGVGKFHLVNYLFICFSVCITAMCSLSFVFTIRDTSYRCLIPECEDTDMKSFEQDWLTYAIPFKDNFPNRCERYAASKHSDVKHIVVRTGNMEYCTSKTFDNSTTIPCEVWIYKENNTSIEEFDIPCEDWKRSMVGSVNSIGQSVSLIFSGYLADKFGRRNVMSIMTSLLGVVGLMQSFSTDYTCFLILEFLNMTASKGAYITAYILGIEILSAKKRIYGCMLLEFTVTTGNIILGILAWISPTWRFLLRAISIPSLFATITIFAIPESFRWLYVKGRKREAISVLKKAANVNSKNISEVDFKNIDRTVQDIEVEDTNVENVSIRKLLNSKDLSIRLLICTFLWFSNILVFYGLSLNSVNISSIFENAYINFILASLVEYISICLFAVILKCCKRTISLFFIMLFAGLFCIVYPYLAAINSALQLTLYLISKTLITTSLMLMYIYTTEMFPTSLRNSAMSVSSMGGRIGGALASQVPLLSKYYEGLPMITYGAVVILTAFTVVKLPETKDRKLPDTIEEAEKMG